MACCVKVLVPPAKLYLCSETTCLTPVSTSKKVFSLGPRFKKQTNPTVCYQWFKIPAVKVCKIEGCVLVFHVHAFTCMCPSEKVHPCPSARYSVLCAAAEASRSWASPEAGAGYSKQKPGGSCLRSQSLAQTHWVAWASNYSIATSPASATAAWVRNSSLPENRDFFVL